MGAHIAEADAGIFRHAPQLTAQTIRESSDDELPMLAWAYVLGLDLDNHPECNTFFLVELLNFEVGNGGFVQYFANTKGEYVDETIAALNRIGAETHFDLFREAVDRWRRERAELEPLWETIEGFSRTYELSSLPELDDRWYASPIEALESAYIRAHVDAFASDQP
jgi:hypothetical protein